MCTKSSLTEHPVRVKIATRAQTEQFALLSEQHCSFEGAFFLSETAMDIPGSTAYPVRGRGRTPRRVLQHNAGQHRKKNMNI